MENIGKSKAFLKHFVMESRDVRIRLFRASLAVPLHQYTVNYRL